MVENVIFDVDGTLVDSVDEHAEAWRRAFLEFGRDLVEAVRTDEILSEIVGAQPLEGVRHISMQEE